MFRKPWESKDEASRAAAVSTSSDPKLTASLAAIAQNDPSAVVRLAALKRINTEPFWLDARLSGAPADIRDSADRFIAQQVIKSESDEYRRAREVWLDAIIEEDQNRSLIQTIAKKAPDTKLRQRALAAIHANGFLADCYVEETDPDLAKTILRQITDPSSLERVVPSLKKRSKTKSKAAHERIAELRGMVGASAETEKAHACLKKLDELVLGKGSGHTAEILAGIEQDWASLGQLPLALEQRFQKSRTMVLAILHPPAMPPERVDGDRANQQANEQAKPNHTPAAEADAGPAPDRAIKSTDKGDQLAREQDEAQKEAKKEAKKQAQQKQAEDQLRRNNEAKGLLEEAEQAIDDGHLQQAAVALAGLPKPMPSALRSHETRVKAQYQTLKQWLHWSNNTQRDQLIEKLEASATQDLHPDALRALVQEARKQWKDLENAERTALSDHRRPVAPHAQWRRFSQAIDAIFERIKPALEQRQAYQDSNLEALEDFIQQTTATLEATHQDVNVYLEPLKVARQAIRRLDDLPPKHRATNAKRLKSLMGELSQRVDHLFEDVEQQKRQLVAQAEQLLHEKDAAAAIETAKSLQSQWKKLGRGRRQSDQALWSAFRAPIDPLFDSLKKEHEAQSAERQAKLESLQTLLGEIEDLVKAATSDATAPESDVQSRWARLEDQWLSESQRPKHLNARFEKAQAQLRKHLDTQQAKAKSKARAVVDALADQLQAALMARSEASGHKSDAPVGQELAPADPKELTGAPRYLLESFEVLRTTHQKLQSQEEPPEQLQEQSPKQSLESWQELAETHHALARVVVVEMEFLSGLESPDADADLKKAFQVAQLNERLNQRGQSSSLADDLSSRIIRWYSAIPMSPAHYPDLSARFKRARDVLEAMLG